MADTSAAAASDHDLVGGAAAASVRDVLVSAGARLAFSATARLDAELLMAHALGTSRGDLLLSRLDQPVPAAFDALLDRRLRHEPVAYIVGKRGFWTIDLDVGPGVLIPRADSETLIEAAIKARAGRPPPRILDLGTGSGALLLAALANWPDAWGTGIDLAPAAVATATANAARLGLADRTRIVEADWDQATGHYDLILCNPPYVASGERLPREVIDHEPAAALFAGADGLDAYRVIAPLLGGLLAPGGVAVVEIGWTQAAAVTALIEARRLSATLVRDLAGRPRALVIC